ncbi:hypothetical protein [Olsenella profusa]|uniref:hypothetical protein n=1 Tax=Olsenella profusa TaxID=138595 RepID=UPI0027D90973|nr:hypothetical protein [Olsenella profusa]
MTKKCSGHQANEGREHICDHQDALAIEAIGNNSTHGINDERADRLTNLIDPQKELANGTLAGEPEAVRIVEEYVAKATETLPQMRKAWLAISRLGRASPPERFVIQPQPNHCCSTRAED